LNLDEVTKTNPNSLKIKKLGFFVFKKFYFSDIKAFRES